MPLVEALISPVELLFNVKFPEFVNVVLQVNDEFDNVSCSPDVYVLVPLCVAVFVGVLLPPEAGISPNDALLAGEVILGLFQESE